MIYVSEEDRKRIALAKDAVRAFAGMVGWTPVPCTSTMPSVLAGFEYADCANTVMAHWQKKLSLTALIKAVAECRTDLFLVEPSHVSGKQASNYITLLLCRDGEVQIVTGLLLWLQEPGGPIHLVTNPDDGDEMRAFMVDRSGIRPLPTLPWATAEAERLGYWTARRHWQLSIGGHYA
ncbi:hypothetical protein I5E68_12050 [Novosphingobium sp. YJ-S2-02]|uniref:Uncharacterized protein n=1 Tax=Novosphingobium aureum TaxID=2792964 RepID=A0A931MLS1_9SPHN|nr:hypothetical protein [Novosphingobium aureum]MBH0113680.1 hypothetical protein [Novosphingobium aureum]